MRDLLLRAQQGGYAVGYFEAFNMDALLAVLSAAEKASSPVIIGFGGQFLSSPKRENPENIYHYGALALEAAKRTPVPCAAMLNEADALDMVYQGMNAGFNALMYQKPGETPEETTRVTKRICEVAHRLDIDVESEVGELPMAHISDGSQTRGMNTDVGKAKAFIRDTEVDALAVAVGNVHLLEGAKSSLDFELLGRLRKEISVPLVLHGGTGVSEGDMKRAIGMGICKINVGTMLKRAYISAVNRFCAERDLNRIDPHETLGWGGKNDMLDCGRSAIEKAVLNFMKLLGSAGKAI